jgi:phage shock protein PspC (stress-responsive transcriptional regulator)
VDYLKQQLGEPGDFQEDAEPGTASGKKSQDPADAKANQEAGTKRLFRDTDNAMLAGVCAGLAGYFGLDTVVVRLLFAALTIFSGGSILVVYILLWLVVPAAVTTSEKLQMHGKPVTLDALKESVSKADVPGAARRANTYLLPLIDKIMRVALKLFGIAFITAGLSTLFSLGLAKIYMLLHDGRLFQENLFPVGAREQWLLGTGMLAVAFIAILLILAGISGFKRKWPIHGWATGVLVGLFMASSMASVALAADAAPRVQERYETSMHTTAIKDVQPFSKVVTDGSVDISYISSPDYAVNLHYFDHPDLSKVKITVRDKILYIDSRELDDTNHCTMLCLFPRYNMTVQVYAPNVQDFDTPRNTEVFYPLDPVRLN